MVTGMMTPRIDRMGGIIKKLASLNRIDRPIFPGQAPVLPLANPAT
jgi:hypothetical protein